MADYPLARSRDEAIRWFEGGGGGAMGPHMGTSAPSGVQTMAADADPGRMGGTGSDGNEAENKQNGEEGGGVEAVEMQPESSFSSYGTTQVNILTLVSSLNCS